jgi:polyhydroxybutyrate depolymerase
MNTTYSKRRTLFALAGVVAILMVADNCAFADKTETHSRLEIELSVEGVMRQAIVFVPDDSSTEEHPVVFGFHGHGGLAADAEQSFGLHRLWPEAIVVYMQGLPFVGNVKNSSGRPGWQMMVGETDDRDFKFFDMLLAKLQEDHKVNTKRIYVMGHSMGGSFTFLLWLARPNIFAALAPSGAYVAQEAQRLKPKPMLHVAGREDKVVKFAGQEKSIKAIRRLNRCQAKGTEWAPNCTLYKSSTGNDVVAYIHDGGHNFPDEAPERIIRFFKEH